MNFNIEIGKMLEVISKEPMARRFSYVALFLELYSRRLWTCILIFLLSFFMIIFIIRNNIKLTSRRIVYEV